MCKNANSGDRSDTELCEILPIGRGKMEVLEFCGVISSTSDHGSSAIVTLDSEIDGVNYGVITPSTKGLISLMNGRGPLKPDTKVCGQAVRGLDGLDITWVLAVV